MKGRNNAVKIAFGSVPKDGGTFTFYRTIRPQLLLQGIDIQCVSVGKEEARLWDSTFSDEGCYCIAEKCSSIKEQSKIFSEWCELKSIDIVLGSNSTAILSSIPHLSEKIRAMSRCANSFDHGYQITMSGYHRLAGIVAQTPRQIKDLTEKYGADRKKMCLIPNGVDLERFQKAAFVERGKEKELKIGFLGRIEHNQKGVLFIPEIVKALNEKGVAFQLKIAGKGVHEDYLKNRMKDYIKNGQVKFIGALSHHNIPEYLSNTDVMLFTSQFEGCPNALLEGMAAGCTPVASRLYGITDFIIEDGVSGYLCSVGDCQAFANKIFCLYNDRRKLNNMAVSAAETMRNRFSQTRMANDYATFFKKIMETPPPIWDPVPWSEFRVDPAFPQTWKRFIPGTVKRGTKGILYTLGLSNRST